MIYEFRTYTLHPRTLPEFLKRWTDALEPRLKLSPLAAFWYTEIGPLNQVIHVWPYENVLERSQDPRRGHQARHLATQNLGVHRRDEVGDFRAPALLAAHGAVE